MPSKFEPCGLGQMISLRYGTIPIVRSTGGLADTVVDMPADPSAGNGVVFRDYAREALLGAVQRAVAFYRVRTGWGAFPRGASHVGVSWEASARQYVALYERAPGPL